MLRTAVFLAAAFFASPALATGGFTCEANDGSRLALSGVTGHGVVTPLVGARLRLGERLLSSDGDAPGLAIAQSWIDDERLWVDLVDPQAMRFEARLRVKVGKGGATGTLERDGRAHPVRCEVD